MGWARRSSLAVVVAMWISCVPVGWFGPSPVSAATAPACTADTTHFPSDSCSVTALTDHSMTESFTTVPKYPTCQNGAPDPGTFEMFGQFALSMAGPGAGADDVKISGSCPDADANMTFTTPTDYVGDFNAEPQTCSITWTWNAATEFPLDSAINMTEEDGEAITDSPMADHTFGVTLPPPGPVADFTATPSNSDPGEFTFTDKSYSVISNVTIKHEAWSTSDGDSGTGKTWDHTFAAIGTYQVDLTVTDSNGKTASTSQHVKVTGVGGGSASISVKEALSPVGDQGRFDLYVGTKLVKASAGDGDHGVAHVTPGRYLVVQRAMTVGLTHYGIRLSCTKNGRHDFTTASYGATVKVSAGDAEVCTFTDTRSTANHCDVPQLAGRSLPAAKRALRAADCAVGKIHRHKHAKPSSLVVRSTAPQAFAVTKARRPVSIVMGT